MKNWIINWIILFLKYVYRVISLILIPASMKRLYLQSLYLNITVQSHYCHWLVSISKFLLSKKQLVISIKCYVQHHDNCCKCKTGEKLPHQELVPTVWADPCAMPGTDHLYLPLIGHQGEEEEENHCNDCSLDPQPPQSLVI